MVLSKRGLTSGEGVSARILDSAFGLRRVRVDMDTFRVWCPFAEKFWFANWWDVCNLWDLPGEGESQDRRSEV